MKPHGAHAAQPRRSTLPRWEDICLAVASLAEQQGKPSYRLADASLPKPFARRSDFICRPLSHPTATRHPPPATNIAAAFRLGAAFARPQLQSVPQGLGLIENALWTITADIDATLAQHATARADFLLECAPNARQNPHLTKHTSVLYFHTALISTGCFSATGACQSDAQICRGPILPGPNPVRKMITRLSLPPKAPVPTMPPRLLTNPEHHPITR